MEANQGDEFGLTSPVFSHEARSLEPVVSRTEERLEVLVIFTDAPGTSAALHMAEGLAQKLAAHIRLILPYEVPYALPLTKPPVPVEFLEGQVRDLAGTTNLNVAAEIYLCRDKRRTLELLLKPQSLVILGGRRHWWGSTAERLVRAIQRDGHQVVFAESR